MVGVVAGDRLVNCDVAGLCIDEAGEFFGERCDQRLGFLLRHDALGLAATAIDIDAGETDGVGSGAGPVDVRQVLRVGVGGIVL